MTPSPRPGTPSIVGGVDAVEVDRVRMRGSVAELDPQLLALAAAKRRSGDAAVVGPGRELDAGRHLDLLVQGDQLPFAQDPAAGEPPRLSVVEVAQQLGRVEAVRRGGRPSLPRGNPGARRRRACSCAVLGGLRDGLVGVGPLRGPVRRRSA